MVRKIGKNVKDEKRVQPVCHVDILRHFNFIFWLYFSREISRLQNPQTQLEIEAQICQLQLYCAFFSFTGASACVHLERFDEAITWCDKGLAVSFTKVDEIVFSKRLCSCHTPCKTYKLGTRKVHLVMVFSVNTY